MKKKFFVLLLFLILYLTLFPVIALGQAQHTEKNPDNLLLLQRVLVNYVYDGDTIRTAEGENVRLLGIDTPEMNWGQGSADFFAVEAFNYTKEELLGKYVYLEYGQEKRDNYGRLLAYLFLSDGTFFNQWLLKEGYAGLLLIAPNLKYSEVFKVTAAKARVSSRGIWNRWEGLSEKLPVITWQQADQYLNKEVIVEGKIVKVQEAEKLIFLYFTADKEAGFYLVIFRHTLNRFDYDPVDFLLGKEVKVSGKVVEYEGILEIIISDSLQISILDNKTPFERKE